MIAFFHDLLSNYNTLVSTSQRDTPKKHSYIDKLIGEVSLQCERVGSIKSSVTWTTEPALGPTRVCEILAGVKCCTYEKNLRDVVVGHLQIPQRSCHAHQRKRDVQSSNHINWIGVGGEGGGLTRELFNLTSPLVPNLLIHSICINAYYSTSFFFLLLKFCSYKILFYFYSYSNACFLVLIFHTYPLGSSRGHEEKNIPG